MRPVLFAVAVSLLVSASTMAQQSQSTPPSAQVHPVPATIPGSLQFDLTSQATGLAYRIYVHKPSSPPPASGYPIVFLTDGDLTFGATTARTALEGLVKDLRPSVIVAIGYASPDRLAWMKLRTGDLTPTAPKADAASPVDTAGSGNAEKFYKFITEELRPALAAIAPLDPADQTLYGHSLGGLFTLHVLFSHPNSFRTFVASSPSIWWDNRSVLKEEAGFVSAVSAGKYSPR